MKRFTSVTLIIALFSAQFMASASASTNSIFIKSVEYIRTVHSPTRLPALKNSKFSISIAPTNLSEGHGGVFTFNSALDVNHDMGTAPVFGATANNNQNDFKTIGSCLAIYQVYSSCSSVLSYFAGKIQTQTLPKELPLDQHELSLDAKGNYWALVADVKKCTLSKLFCGSNPETREFIDCRVVSFDTGGRLLFSWNASENLPTSELRNSKWETSGFYLGNVADPFHCNSVNFRNGKVLISMRHTDSVYMVDATSSLVLGKLGGNYWRGVSFQNDQLSGDLTSGQHDAEWVSDSDISVYDNETLSSNPARGLLLRINFGSHKYRVIREFDDPSGQNSFCTGSFTSTQTVPLYWVAQWGCSTSGLTVFSNYATPIVSLKLSDSTANQQFLAATFEPIRYQLGYRARISSTG